MVAAQQGALRTIKDEKGAPQGHKCVCGGGDEHLSMALRACLEYRKEELAQSIAAVS